MPVEAIRVVHSCGAVDADPDGEAVLGEKAAPTLVEQCRVGLKVVDTAPTLRQMTALELYDLAVELRAQPGSAPRRASRNALPGRGWQR